MTTYTAYFYTDGDFATYDGLRPTRPSRRLRWRARASYDDDPVDLTFEPYDGGLT